MTHYALIPLNLFDGAPQGSGSESSSAQTGSQEASVPSENAPAENPAGEDIPGDGTGNTAYPQSCSESGGASDECNPESSASAPDIAGDPAAPDSDAGNNEPEPGMKLRELQMKLRAAEKIAGINSIISDWQSQAEKMREIYPDFDFRSCVRAGGDFAALIKAGCSVRKAYEAANIEKILAGAMRFAAKNASIKTANSMRAARPQENPVNDRASSVNRTDVGSLTEKDIMRILGEVSRGAKVTF